MMRSDMPKQIMAYRNGGGLPSLATAPMEFSNGGGIGSFISNAYNKAVGVVTNALGMNDNKSYAPELTTQPGPESNQMSAKEKFDSNPARQASVARKKRKKKKARQAAAREAAAAAAAAAAEQQAAATSTAIDQGVGSLDTNVDVANAYIENMVAGRDDLTDLEKLDFANQLAEQFDVVGGSGQQAAIDNVLNKALDPFLQKEDGSPYLTDQEMLQYLNAAGDASGVYETGLINTLTSNISAAEQLAAEQAAAEAAAAAQAQADQLAAEQAAAAAAQAEQEAAAAAAAAAAQAQADQLAASAAAANQFSLSGAGSGAGYGTYNTNPINTGQPITTSANYAPIVPFSNVNTAGIAGLPSTGMSNIQPYTFTAYTPGAYTPTVNPLVLPPLG